MQRAFIILLSAFTVLVLLRFRAALPERKFLANEAER